MKHLRNLCIGLAPLVVPSAILVFGPHFIGIELTALLVVVTFAVATFNLDKINFDK